VKKRIFYATTLATLILFNFQNCGLIGDSSHSDQNSLGGKTCLAVAQRAFSETYYPHLRSQCSQCHGLGGAGISWFANQDQNSAFDAFMSTSRAKINTVMVYAGHPGPNNGPNQEGWVAAQSAQWKNIDKQVDDCINGSAVNTVSKNNSVQDVAITDNNDSNKRPWRTLEFDLFSDMANAQQNGAVQMVVRVRYRESGANTGTVAAPVYGSDIGYEFSRPTARIRAGAPAGTQYVIEKISIFRNGVRMPTASGFEAINDVVVSATTDTVLLESSTTVGVVSPKDLANDVFSLRFAEIRDGNGRSVGGPGTGPGPGGPSVPARITFVELSTAANQYGYFARSCNGCHSGASPAGGLNMTNFAASSLAAASIRSRVNNPLRPMPPAGLLPQFERDVISRWVDIGAPQN
jgi:hypothetical protein